MTRKSQELLEAALGLQESERAELASRILDSLGQATTDEEVERAWAVEIERRARRVLAQGPTGDEGDLVVERVAQNLSVR